MAATTNIYVLRCSGWNYYIAQSADEKSFEDIVKDCECEWTKMYKPVSIEKVIQGAEIDNVVKEYMKKVGIMMVRGGSYRDYYLEGNQLAGLIKEFGYDADDGDCSCCSPCGGDHSDSEYDSGCDSE